MAVCASGHWMVGTRTAGWRWWVAVAEGYWQFCEILERRTVTAPTIASPPETERVVLEQHTEHGDYRLRPLTDVMEAAEAPSEPE